MPVRCAGGAGWCLGQRWHRLPTRQQHHLTRRSPPPSTAAAYPYRALNGVSVNAPGFLAQCDRAFLTGQAAKLGLVRVTDTPASTPVDPTKLALITALAAQPAVATLSADASLQHYHSGVWSSAACTAGAALPGDGAAGCLRCAPAAAACFAPLPLLLPTPPAAPLPAQLLQAPPPPTPCC